MAYNKRQKLLDNIEAIRVAFEVSKSGNCSKEQREALLKYSGFGGLKFVLNPVTYDKELGAFRTKPETWVKSDQPFMEDVLTLHKLIMENSQDEKEYQRYVRSIKSSVLSAFYTPMPVIQALSQSMKKAGITVTSFLDPSSGKGSFVEAFRGDNPDMKVTAFEKDLLTGLVLKGLYPQDDVHVDGYETIDKHLLGTFDVAASNIPFGDISVFDQAYTKSDNEANRQASKAIHNYFFLKTLDNVREGGIVAFITSQGVMDSPRNKEIRKAMMERAYLVGAVRLPNNLFTDEAGTEVGSDLIILQKDSSKSRTYTEYSPEESAFIDNINDFKGEQESLESLDLGEGMAEKYRQANPNSYVFLSEYLWDVDSAYLGEHTFGTDQYGKFAIVSKYDGTMQQLADALAKRLDGFFEYDFNKQLYLDHQPKVEEAQAVEVKAEPQAQSKPKKADRKPEATQAAAPLQLDLFSMWDQQEEQRLSMEPRRFDGKLLPHYRDGIVIIDNDQVGVLANVGYGTTFKPMDIQDDLLQRLRLYIPVRDAYQALYSAESDEHQEHPELREQLNRAYDAFSRRFGALNEKKNVKALIFDAMGRDLLCIENCQEGKFVKSDIFQRPIMLRRQRRRWPPP